MESYAHPGIVACSALCPCSWAGNVRVADRIDSYDAARVYCRSWLTPPDRAVPADCQPLPTPRPGNPVVLISTSLGDITVELFKDRAPVSVENFLQYANEGFYTDTVFHRVSKGFMIQGGGYTAPLVEKPTRPPIRTRPPTA